MIPVTGRIRFLVFVATLMTGYGSRSAAFAQGTSATGNHATRLSDATDRFLVAGDVRLRYREIGRGEPIVLLHGATRNLESWVGFADSLAADHHRVIALDLRGHGQSSKFTDRAHFGRAMVDDVVRLLDTLRIQRAHLVGHSLGAVIAANVTARYRARVVSASLVAPPLYTDSAAYMQVHAAAIEDIERGAGMARLNQIVFPGMPDSIANAFSVATLAVIPAPTLAALFESVSSLALPPSTAAAVRGVAALVVVGSADPLITQARWLASWWPQARLIEVPDANHGSVIDRPEVWAAIRRQVRTHAGSASPQG